MEQEVYRHVPYDIEVEQALLGAILVDNAVLERVSSALKPDHFYDPLHQRIYEMMHAQSERGGMIITPLTLNAAMKADPGLIEVGGPPKPRQNDHELRSNDDSSRCKILSSVCKKTTTIGPTTMPIGPSA